MEDGPCFPAGPLSTLPAAKRPNPSRARLSFDSGRRRHGSFGCDWSSDVCSSDLELLAERGAQAGARLARWGGGGEVLERQRLGRVEEEYRRSLARHDPEDLLE